MLKQDVMPCLRFNSIYANILKQSKGKGLLGAQLQEADWLQ